MSEREGGVGLAVFFFNQKFKNIIIPELALIEFQDCPRPVFFAEQINVRYVCL